MNVRMVRQRLAPSVQNGEAANPRSEPAVIGGQRGHGLDHGLEQDRMDGALILEGDGRDRRGQREYDVEIGNRQQFGLPIGQPLRPRRPLALRAMPIAARVVGDARRLAIVTGFEWPPSAAVRLAVIALMTRCSVRPTCPTWSRR